MARRAARSAAPLAPVTWRDGVHLTGTPIWCDARRRRDVCFVSSVERIGKPGHGQLIGTAPMLALLGAYGGGHLAVPLRQRFTLGTLRLELIPSGRGLGTAALWVDAIGRTALYAGAIRPTLAPGSLGEVAEVRSCDALVIDAPFGEPHHAFAPWADVAAQVTAWVRTQLAAGARVALDVDSVLDGLEVAAQLAADGLAVAGSRVMREAAARLTGMATRVPVLDPLRKDARLVIRLEGEHTRLASPPRTALVSARAIDPAPASAHHTRFAWPFVAGRAPLLAWIEQARAKDIFVTGAGAEAIVAALGPRARLLGPPRQMTLFPPVREAPR